MALGTEPYRHLYAADLTALRELSVMAERVYVHLACGERSSACCMASCDPEHLRYSVRARRTAEVMDALAELEAAGWLVLDLSCKQAWLPVQARRTWIVSESSATGWRNDLSRFKLSVATRQAAAFIDSAPVPPPKGHASTPDLRSRNSSSNRSSIPTVDKSTVPAPPDVSQAVELELTAPAKPARTLTAGQQDAIFAKQMIRMFADRWNTVMAGDCAPVIAKSLDVKATALAKNCAAIKHIDEETTPGADLTKLYEWAQVRHDYHAGKGGRPWTFEAWHAADHLAQVFADYRQERLQAGGPKNFAFNVDRTLTQWRESVEYRQQREADHGA